MTRQIVESIFYSYFYNRSRYHVYDLCEEVKARIIGTDDVDLTDDGDIIFGFLVLLYGEYGTSPRSGWLVNENNKNYIIDYINDIIEKLKE